MNILLPSIVGAAVLGGNIDHYEDVNEWGNDEIDSNIIRCGRMSLTERRCRTCLQSQGLGDAEKVSEKGKKESGDQSRP